MAYFTASYQIFSDDVSALGPKKYLTSTQVHSALWQRLLTDLVFAENPRARDEFDDLSLLFGEGYNHVLGSVTVGEFVAVLVSFEARAASTLRVFFRVVRHDGEPVACGFQTIRFASRTRGEAVALPLSLTELLRERADLREVSHRAFAECILSGSHFEELFPADVRTLGSRVASRPPEQPIAAQGRRSSTGVRASGSERPTGGMRASASLRASGAIQAPSLTRATGAMRASGMMRASGAAGPQRASGVFPMSEPPRRSGMFAGPLPEFADLVVRNHGVAFVFPGLGAYDGRLLRELYDYMPYLDEYFELADRVARRRLRHSFLPLVHVASIGEHDEYLRKCPELESFGVFLTGVLLAEALQEKSVRPDVLVGHGFGELAALVAGGALEVATGLEIVAERVIALRATPDASPGTDALAPAAARFKAAIAGLTFGTPRMQVYSPTELKPYLPGADIPTMLASQLERPAHLDTAVSNLRAAGCEFFVECGSGGLVDVLRMSAPNAGSVHAAAVAGRSLNASLVSASNAVNKAVATTPAPARQAAEVTKSEEASGWPVAIVGMGCVLPGAGNPDELWRSVLEGISGISEPPPGDSAYRDFVVGDDVVPDRTYTLLSGAVGAVEYDARVAFTREEFFGLSRAQQLLALALAQCLDRPRAAWASAPKRTACLLGSTAGGNRDYDETLMVADLRAEVDRFSEEPSDVRSAFSDALTRLSELRSGNTEANAPFAAFRRVVEQALGPSTDTVLLDAAGASSLYALSRACQLLWSDRSDLVIAGGVFAPGPATSTMYAQFRGLSTTDSFPFDERAEGVVLAEGAAVLALKRLPDAITAGDRIYAVVRGVGLSSDGKSPSLNVPRAAGELLAMRRAYAVSGVDPSSVQMVEADAGSKPVADATEFDGLRALFGTRDAGLAPISLHSVKALTGDTGWLAGAASIITVCRALEEHVLPPQYNFSMPNAAIDLANSPFDIPLAAAAWPPNVHGLPRRAAVDSFGFGGANGHAVLEAFDPGVHTTSTSRSTPPATTLAIVAIKQTAPGDLARAGSGPSDLRQLVPEALEQLDESQRLLLVAADRALKEMTLWAAHRERIGVALALVGQTARGAAVTKRAYLPRVLRLLDEHASKTGSTREMFGRLTRRLAEAVARETPSNAFTLAGAMPNFCASRIANMFDLNGPSVVIDAGGASLLETLRQAHLWLAFGDADVVLAGAVDTQGNDGACILAVTTPKLARAQGWIIEALVQVDQSEDNTVTIRSPGSEPSTRTIPMEATFTRQSNQLSGISELVAAIDATKKGKVATLRWSVGEAVARGEYDGQSVTTSGSASQV